MFSLQMEMIQFHVALDGVSSWSVPTFFVDKFQARKKGRRGMGGLRMWHCGSPFRKPRAPERNATMPRKTNKVRIQEQGKSRMAKTGENET